MSHNREIIINVVSPPAEGAAAAASTEPEFRIRVEYRPTHEVTPSQMGNEVARILKRSNQIIEGTPD